MPTRLASRKARTGHWVFEKSYVSLGNVYRQPPCLDWPLMNRMQSSVIFMRTGPCLSLDGLIRGSRYAKAITRIGMT
jgi:hypothetical protein